MTTITEPGARPAMLDTMAVTDEARWQAVLERAARADGRFVYAVTTTGVYCRPTCPSRRPRRENVRFFDSPTLAEAAGFRECRRCYPKRESTAERIVAETTRLIEMSDDGPAPSLATLAAGLGISAGYLQRRFKQATGLSPHAYATQRRTAALKARLRIGEDVTTATYEAGYGSISRVYEAAPSMLGMTPATYKRGGSGATIAWSTTETPFGLVLLAATQRGLCFVAIGDSSDELVEQLRQEFPAAVVEPGDVAMNAYVDGLHAYLESGLRTTQLPLDVTGTRFERLVWHALRSIPPGETRSYGEIARTIGRPTSVRAVASACAHNPTALIVPCHRVVPETGGAGGYRWGTGRKRALIEHEHRASE